MLPDPAATAPPYAALTLALWGNAVLDHRTSLDEAADAVGATHLHRVDGLPGEDGPAAVTVALGRLRAAGARTLVAVLPVPGDPAGVAGPRAFTEAAVTAGQAVLVPDLGLGLVPVAGPEIVVWQVSSGLPVTTPPPSIGEASRALREAVLEASATLAELDPPTVNGSGALGRLDDLALPPGLDPRAYELVDRAGRLLHAIRSALADPAVTTSAGLDARRRAALVPVERAARVALASASQRAPVSRSS